MASSSPAQDRDNQLLEVGKQCSDASCLLVDFLPFKCHHCELSFCQDHFKVDAHKCPKYDENKYNRVAPNCPLCNIPVAVRPGQDPNVRMDMHLEKECSVVTGKVKSKSTPTCARGNCKKVLFSPIRCDKCKAQFCAAHRFPQDHNCCTPAQSNTTGRLANLNTGARNLDSKASLAGAAAVDAVKKSMTSAVASTSRPAQSSVSSSTGKPSFPFNKTDRRARSERASRVKAMRARAKKGLLSEEEKAILAAEEAAIEQDKKECVIM